jgi:tetratricopeptide (TPR) repeat protein
MTSQICLPVNFSHSSRQNVPPSAPSQLTWGFLFIPIPAEKLFTYRRVDQQANLPGMEETRTLVNNHLNRIEHGSALIPFAIPSIQTQINELEDFLEKKNGHSNDYKYQDTLLIAEEILKLDPRHVEALHTRSYCLWKLNLLPDALRTLDYHLMLYPKDIGAWARRGVIKLQQHHFFEALEDFKFFYFLNQDSTFIQFSFLADCRYAFKQGQKATTSDFESLLNLYPYSTYEILLLRGIFYISYNDYSQAVKDLNEASSIFPNFHLALTLLQIIQKKLKVFPINAQEIHFRQSGRGAIAM